MKAKVGFPGGTEWHINGWLLMMIAIVGTGLFVSLAVDKAFADPSEFHKHYCSEHNADPANCIPDKESENTVDQSETEEYEKDRDEQLDDLNEQIKKQKQVLIDIEKDILKAKKLIQENEIKMNIAEQKTKSEKISLQNIKKELRDKKSEIRQWVPPQNVTDAYSEKKRLDEEYRLLGISHDNKVKSYEDSIKDYEKSKTEYWDSYDAIPVAEQLLKDELDKLNELKSSFRTIYHKTNLISVVLSRTCDITIKMQWEAEQLDPDHYNPSSCLTYRELKQFDNTISAISGEFQDLGYDLNRMKPGIKNTYDYYKQFPFWKVIAVDADYQFLTHSAVITVQPQDVKYVKTLGQDDKSESIDFDKMEQYVYRDVIVSEDCRHASVSPKIEAVRTAIEHFMENCSPPKSEWEVFSIIKLVSLEGIGIADEQSQKAINWFAQISREMAGLAN